MIAQNIEIRVKVLEEIEAIKRLRYTYCYLCDRREIDELLKLFVEDAQADFHEFGRYVGNAEIAKFFKDIAPSKMTFFVHMVHNPIIDVIDTEHAIGKWYADIPAIIDGEARWICGRYEEEYIKEGENWKFKVLNFFWYYETPFDKGWVKERMKF